MVLRVLVLYIPLPMFWALFDQQVRCRRTASAALTSALSRAGSDAWASGRVPAGPFRRPG